MHLSLEILTKEENGLLLYSGPDDKTPPKGGYLYTDRQFIRRSTKISNYEQTSNEGDVKSVDKDDIFIFDIKSVENIPALKSSNEIQKLSNYRTFLNSLQSLKQHNSKLRKRRKSRHFSRTHGAYRENIRKSRSLYQSHAEYLEKSPLVNNEIEYNFTNILDANQRLLQHRLKPERNSVEMNFNEEQSTEIIHLELKQGKPHLLINLGGGPVNLSLNSSYSLSDNTWHRIDIIWKEKVRNAHFYNEFNTCYM